MLMFTCSFLRSSALATAFVASPFLAEAMEFEFYNGGFSEGAFVKGMFAGEDLNGDGFIIGPGNSTLPNELTAFRLTFSGNSIVPAFTIPGPERDFLLIYTLGSGDFGKSDIPGFPTFRTGILAPYFVPDGSGSFEYAIGLSNRDCVAAPPCAFVAHNFPHGGTGDATDRTAVVTELPAPVPLPASLGLLGGALAALGAAARRRRAGRGGVRGRDQAPAGGVRASASPEM